MSIPKVEPGDGIRFFPNGDTTNVGHPGVVTQVSGQTISCLVYQVASVQVREFIPHISDPRLQENENVRAEGAWDLSPQQKTLNRLAAELLGEPAKKKSA